MSAGQFVNAVLNIQKLGTQTQQTLVSKYNHEWVDYSGLNDQEQQLFQGYNINKEQMSHIKQIKKQYKNMNGKPNECVKEEKKMDNDTQMAILVIGTTGTGKSSLCGLLSGQKSIGPSSGSKRGTDTTLLIPSKYDKNIYFIDTMGTKDSNINISDQQILKDVLKCIHSRRINKIKILWCISGDTKTRAGPFGHEAKFIGSLQNNNYNNNYNDNYKHSSSQTTTNGNTDDEKEGLVAFNTNITSSIWNTVLIIKKEGKPMIKAKRLSGVLAAAKSYGAADIIDTNLDQHTFGFICTDKKWDFDPDEHDYDDIDVIKREEKGFFTAERARQVITNKLNQLPLYELNFRTEKCRRCAVVGDSRYIYAPCHTEKVLLHNSSKSWQHPGYVVKYHPKGLGQNKVGIIGYHTGQLKNIHKGKIISIHPGKLKKYSLARELASIFTISMSETVFYEPEDWYWYDCCNKWKGDATECRTQWSCCAQHSTALLCENSPLIWTCCRQLKYQSVGCTEVVETKFLYECCSKPEGATGCTVKYNCCGKTGRGCQQFYPCCCKVISGLEPKGCTEKCKLCRQLWGKPKGCYPTNH